jgi:3-hydroxybutyryl-CoA dehydrogenase
VRIKRVAVIGAGTMGHGIAQLFASAGLMVALTDSDRQVLDGAIERIRTNLGKLLESDPTGRETIDTMCGRIIAVSDLENAASGADFVVEAVLESLEIKHRVHSELEIHCSPHTIIASTTSSYRVRDMAGALHLPERFLVTHFWNPAYIIPAVEVMPGTQTSAETVETTMALLKAAGKHPALVKRDVAGFIGNRLQHALRREAISIVAQGIASPEDVDLIARLSFGLRMPVVGPLETVDLGGLDLTRAIQTYLLPELERSTEPLPLIQEMVGQGELGAKAGQGFFHWPPGKVETVIQRRDKALLEMLNWLSDRGFLPGQNDPSRIGQENMSE